jgi:aryl-phospho-beta-D-glucosidase BglC (GH1 family)
LPDTAGGTFVTAPTVKKVVFEPPYDEVITSDSPHAVPIVRIPLTASSYVYSADDNKLGAEGYQILVDLLVQYFTSRGVAVIIDQHASCAGGGHMNCSNRQGPMALRMFGNATGGAAFWTAVAERYANNSLVFYELYNEPHNIWYQVSHAVS